MSSIKIHSNDISHKNSEQEKKTFCVAIKNILQLGYNQIMQSKFPVCFCMLLYFFICLFGNVVTGIFLYKHEFMTKQNETIKDILTTRLDSSDSLQANKNNQTLISDTEDHTKIENFDLNEIIKHIEFNHSSVEVSRKISTQYSIYLLNQKIYISMFYQALNK